MLIWGTQAQVNLLALVHFVCGVCHQDAPQRILERVNRFTFFFIPLFVTSRQHYVDCAGCGATYLITQDYAQQWVDWAQRASGGAPPEGSPGTAADTA